MGNAADFRMENSTLVRYLGADVRVVVPDHVKAIGPGAFRRQERIRTVHQIGAEAFITASGGTTLHGTASSYAETYAKENDIPFVAE